jgi:hypothetical protein
MVVVHTRICKTTEREDKHMQSTTEARSPLWTSIRDELRDARAARAARRSLERELAGYTSPRDLDDFEATLGRYDEDETADIRSVLAARRSA